MQMGPKEIARDYRTAANKQKQIKVLAELNQCAERRIAEILDDEGEELPKKWQEQLLKPSRRSWKFPDGEASRESSVVSREETEAEQAAPVAADARRGEDPSTPAAPPFRMTGGTETVTDRDLFDAVATLLPDGSRGDPAPEAMPEKQDEDPPAEETVDLDAWDNRGQLIPLNIPEITAEDLLRAACRMLTSALELEPDRYHTYSCGVLDLVHALTEEEV